MNISSNFQVAQKESLDKNGLDSILDKILTAKDTSDCLDSVAYLTGEKESTVCTRILLGLCGRGLVVTLLDGNRGFIVECLLRSMASAFPKNAEGLSTLEADWWKRGVADFAKCVTAFPQIVVCEFSNLVKKTLELEIGMPSHASADVILQPVLEIVFALGSHVRKIIEDSGDVIPDIDFVQGYLEMARDVTGTVDRDLRTKIATQMLENGVAESILRCSKALEKHFVKWGAFLSFTHALSALANLCFVQSARLPLKDLQTHELFLSVVDSDVTDDDMKRAACYGIALLLGADEEDSAVAVGPEVTHCFDALSAEN